MKKTFTQFLLSSILILAFSNKTFSQNWQYVGPANINNSVGFNTYLYWGDVELNATGDVFVGYYSATSGIPAVNFAMYSGSTWSLFPTITSFTANAVDIEVRGTDYYIAYARVKSGNMYAYVQKYNGSSWTQIGDSLLLGNSGSGGYFEFLLDNAGVPTVLGVVNAPLLANKQMMQYNGSAWTSIYTFPNSAGTIFRESSAKFNSLNKLYCTHQGVFMSPLKYFTVVSMIDGGLQTTIGDTIFRQLNTHKLKLDAGETPHLLANGASGTKTYAFKLNASIWNFVGDTTSANAGVMLSADLTGAGKFVFNTQQTNLYRSPYYYNTSNTRTSMDTFNITNPALLAVAELDVYGSSDDVYALTLEMNSSFGQDYSVRKHSAPGSIGIKEINLFNEQFVMYPNPSKGSFKINRKTIKEELPVVIYNSIGEIVYQGLLASDQQVFDLSEKAKGLYFIKIYNGNVAYSNKIIIQ
ncbi:MAG: T9SS type A sorting domain-containing protein [Bacteroidia bacterium]|nr:T9SS type A sorting domain-containing protein [Bacteroidia bacterium]